MANPYWTRLAAPSSPLKGEIDRVLDLFNVRPAGSGYIDIIVSPLKAERFLAALTDLGVAVHTITLWCGANEINKHRYGCPHGMGGPVHNGVWFSEMCERDPFDVEEHGISMSESQLDPFALAQACNSLAWTYVSIGVKGRPEYSPCLAPGFWLAVPEGWRSSVQADAGPHRSSG